MVEEGACGITRFGPQNRNAHFVNVTSGLTTKSAHPKVLLSSGLTTLSYMSTPTYFSESPSQTQGAPDRVPMREGKEGGKQH